MPHVVRRCVRRVKFTRQAGKPRPPPYPPGGGDVRDSASDSASVSSARWHSRMQDYLHDADRATTAAVAPWQSPSAPPPSVTSDRSPRHHHSQTDRDQDHGRAEQRHHHSPPSVASDRSPRSRSLHLQPAPAPEAATGYEGDPGLSRTSARPRRQQQRRRHVT
jgi:hypothetical protein